MFLNIHHIALEKWLILKRAKISKSFFLKSDARFRFLVKNYVRYYIFFFQNFVFKLKKCKKPPKIRVFKKLGLFRGFLHFFQLENKILKKINIVSDIIFYKESESGIHFEEKWFWNFGPLKDEPFFKCNMMNVQEHLWSWNF